jgi:hypothetical protein
VDRRAGIALPYILGTCGMLANVPGDRIDPIAPVSQILGRGFSALHPRFARRSGPLRWWC